jgi:competence protein ComEA
VLALLGAVVLVAVAMAVFVVAGSTPGAVTVERAARAAGESGQPGETAAAAGDVESVVVDVAGAVLRPGVYRLPPGSRLGDAIDAAGGYDPRVDAERAALELNLAAVVSDGDRIRVPSRDDPPGVTATGGGGSATGGAAGGPVNVNSATAAELEELPGIGPVTANKIIAAREEQPFASIDDLLARKVVGNATMDKIRDLVSVR